MREQLADREAIREEILEGASSEFEKEFLEAEKQKVGHFTWLRHLPESYQPTWLADGMVLEGGLNLLLGAPKTRKSMLRRYVQACILAGKPVFGRFKTKQVERSLVLIGESVVEAESAWYHKVCQAVGVEEYGKRIAIERPKSGFDLASDEHFRELVKTIEQERFELLVLDPMINLHHGSENDAESMGKVCGNILRLGDVTTVLMVHHTAKPSENDPFKTIGQRARGSSVLAGSTDTTVFLGRRGLSAKGRLQFESRHALEHEPLEVEFDGATGLWIPASEGVPLESRVATLLKEEPELSANEVQKRLKSSRAETLKLVKEVKNASAIRTGQSDS